MDTSKPWPELGPSEHVHAVTGGEQLSGAEYYAAKANTINGKVPPRGVFVKWSNEFSQTWGTPTYQTAVEDLKTIESLPVPMARTEIRGRASISHNGNAKIVPYLVLQEEAPGPQLTEPELQRREVRDMLKVALEASWDLYLGTGKAVDFMGGESVIRYGEFFRNPGEFPLAVHNFRMNTQGEYVCIDSGLLKPKMAPLYTRPVVTLLAELQHFALSTILNQYFAEGEGVYVERGRFEYLFGDELLDLEGGKISIRQLARVMCAAVDVRKSISRL